MSEKPRLFQIKVVVLIFYEGFGFKTTNTIFQNNVYINKLVLKWGGGGAGYQSGFLYKNNNNINNNDNNNN